MIDHFIHLINFHNIEVSVYIKQTDSKRTYFRPINLFALVIYIITMAQQPYMGLGLLFPRLRGLRICGSSETSRLAALLNH
jgi:hypothetical protein